MKRSDIKYFLTIPFLTETTQKCANFVDALLGRRVHRTGRGHCMGRFRPSCVRLVYFLRKSIEFYVKRTECQRILLLEIAKCCTLSYSLHYHSCCPLSYSIYNHSQIAPQLFPDHSPVELCFSLPSKFWYS